MEHSLAIFHIGIAKNVLGFGTRLLVWFSGCPFNCVGCIEERLHDINFGKYISIENLYNIFEPYLNTIDGITFSGGEPLFQSNSFYELLLKLPSSLNKMLFSGYYVSELNSKQLLCYNMFDLAVMGRFEYNNRGNYLWRGSNNKHFFSPKNTYSEVELTHLESEKSAGVEVIYQKEKIFFYGIPTEQDEIEMLKKGLTKKGIEIRE